MTLSWGGLAVTAIYFYSSLSSDISANTLTFNYALMGFFVGRLRQRQLLVLARFHQKFVSLDYPLRITWHMPYLVD